MKNNEIPDVIAVERFQIIAPVINALKENADEAKISELKHEACEAAKISWKTLNRWLNRYAQKEFNGLIPKIKTFPERRKIPVGIIDEAILLRMEVTSRSIGQIIEILELEGRVEPGFIKKTTLRDRFAERGYSAAQMKQYQKPGIAARRFVRANRNDMWQSDIKYGPFIKVNGKPKQIYFVCFIDDATRYIVHAQFYDNLEQTIVEDAFRQAILKEGVPKRVFFDNGKQFRTTWMKRACAMLGIQLIYAAPYSPEAKGKVERFNQTLTSFLNEVALKKLKTLDEYNGWLKIWLQECYHNKEHGSLGVTPEFAYKSSKAPMRFLPIETIALAFLRLEQRKVDKSGCISFGGKKYEVGVEYVSRTVDITYDPNDTTTLTIEDNALGKSFTVKELVIGEHTGPRPKLPERLTPEKASTSRLLDAKEKVYTARRLSVKRAS
ncbi:hypothetical protein FACS189490_07070 [Clostridia bacterium]|nr:hypothetical protein FACS189490_07070 [Clostridia bacterium]